MTIGTNLLRQISFIYYHRYRLFINSFHHSIVCVTHQDKIQSQFCLHQPILPVQLLNLNYNLIFIYLVNPTFIIHSHVTQTLQKFYQGLIYFKNTVTVFLDSKRVNRQNFSSFVAFNLIHMFINTVYFRLHNI